MNSWKYRGGTFGGNPGGIHGTISEGISGGISRANPGMIPEENLEGFLDLITGQSS